MEKVQSLSARVSAGITIKPISAAKAATWYEGLKYPDGLEESALDIANTSMNFEISGEHGKGVFALKRKGETCWVDAARGTGNYQWLPIGLGAIEAAAKEGGFVRVGMQTARRGLVKQAQALGYEIEGYILKKILT
jgi:hypothetical protein